jgi:hypothetical protein
MWVERGDQWLPAEVEKPQSALVGEFVNHYLMQQRAKALVRRWNDAHPEAPVAAETVEEAVSAYCQAETLGATPAGLECQRRMLEFTLQLPIAFVDTLFLGRDLP